MRAGITGSLLLLLGGCSSDGDAGKGTGEGGGGATQGATGAGASAGGSDGSAGAVELVALPEGSREFDGIVNLVDAEAAQEIDEFLALGMAGLTRSLNLFLAHYEENYDFVFLFTDHEVPDATAAGRFLTVTSQPRVGTGAVSQYLAAGFQTNGRVKGAMGVKYGSGPFSHEIAHYWGVFLDRSFGFGVGKTYNSPAHWGYAGVSGILGGFNPTTLSCQTPLGAAPMDCEPTPNGRYRYVVESFSPGANGLPYAPLELYLMGLASADEVPAEIPVLQDAEDVPDSFDPDTRTEVVEAAGMTALTMSDITARHGVVTELAESERHFSSAFVVVSAAPASDEVLAEVALRAAAFGDRGMHPITKSFASDSGARATMDTELGPRRAVSDPPPPPRPPFECDVLGQDCDDGLTCHGSYCALPGEAKVNEVCELVTDCVAGSHCVYLGDPPLGYCAQYCDRDNDDSPLACASLCTSTITMVDDNGDPQWTVCRPP